MTNKSRSTPRIFISHSHTDNDFCIALVTTLRSIFGENAVWYDKYEIRAGDQWRKKIEKELKQRNVFIVVLSPKANRSSWVKHEVDLALHDQIKNRKLIIPVVYQTCNIPDELKRIQCLVYPPNNDFEGLIKDLQGVLAKNFPINALAKDLEDVDTQYLQDTIVSIEDAFASQDWHFVIAMAKALIARYPNNTPSSIYLMQAQGYLLADEIYEGQLALAKEVAIRGLASAKTSEDRLTLLDVNAYIDISQENWDMAQAYIDNALELAFGTSEEHNWKIIQQWISNRKPQRTSEGTINSIETTIATEAKEGTEVSIPIEVASQLQPSIGSEFQYESTHPFRMSIEWRDFEISVQQHSSLQSTRKHSSSQPFLLVLTLLFAVPAFRSLIRNFPNWGDRYET